ncbi:MAG: hypothetical protein V2B14_07235 [bacterium]
MELIIIIIFTFLIGFVIYVFSGSQSLLQKRLKKFDKFKPKSYMENQFKESDIKDKIIEFVEPMVRKNIKQVKLDSARQLLLQAGEPYTNEDVFRFITKKIIYAGIGLGVALFSAVLGDTDANIKIILCILIPAVFYKLSDMV